jgi:sugar lactone lactonase YvrE
MKPPPVTIAANANCELAENPLWHPDDRSVYWTDIPAGRIYRFDHSTQKYRVIYEGDPVGGFTFQQDGSLLLFRVNDVAHLQLDERVSSFRQFSEDGMDRFNDVIADPEGRVFAGTFGQHPKCGLYRVDVDGTITKLFSGTGCSNGMGFSPDLKTFYWTCSTTRHIFQFDYDRASGAIENRKVFYHATASEGIPDGLAVDSEGCVWSARWGMASVVRHGTDGKVLDSIRLPVTNITSVCFGGENLDLLFITSAQEAGGNNESAGSLFQIRLNTRGTSEFRSRVVLG